MVPSYSFCLYVQGFQQEYVSYCHGGLAHGVKINEWCKDFKSSGMLQCTTGWVVGWLPVFQTINVP